MTQCCLPHGLTLLCWGPMGHLFEIQHKTPRLRDMLRMTTKLRGQQARKWGCLTHDQEGPRDPSLKLQPFPSPRTLERPYQKEPLPVRAQRQNRDHSKNTFKVCCRVSFRSGFLGVYAQEWDCWVIRQFYFQFFKKSPHCFP